MSLSLAWASKSKGSKSGVSARPRGPSIAPSRSTPHARRCAWTTSNARRSPSGRRPPHHCSAHRGNRRPARAALGRGRRRTLASSRRIGLCEETCALTLRSAARRSPRSTGATGTFLPGAPSRASSPRPPISSGRPETIDPAAHLWQAILFYIFLIHSVEHVADILIQFRVEALHFPQQIAQIGDQLLH